MVVGAQREPSHLCSKRQVPLPLAPRADLPWPPCSPALWPCSGSSSLLRVLGLPSLSGFSRECLDHPEGFSAVKARAELWGHGWGFLRGS